MRTITEYLQGKGATFMVTPHVKTYSSLAEARALGIRADEVIKTVMLATTTGHVAAIIPATARVNTRKLEELLNHAGFPLGIHRSLIGSLVECEDDATRAAELEEFTAFLEGAAPGLLLDLREHTVPV